MSPVQATTMEWGVFVGQGWPTPKFEPEFKPRLGRGWRAQCRIKEQEGEEQVCVGKVGRAKIDLCVSIVTCTCVDAYKIRTTPGSRGIERVGGRSVEVVE